jgi:hypothetical protein
VSCEQTSNRLGATAAIKGGLTTLQSKAGNIAGRTLGSLERGLGRSATAALTVANSIDPPRSVDTLLPVAAVGALLGGNKTRHRILNTVGTLQVARAVTTGAGTAAGRLSRTGPAVQRNYFDRVQMRSWPSRLTPLLNAQDIRGIRRLKVLFSQGQMFESRGKTWHLGVTQVQTSQGERTMGHLQSLNAPATHYYFNRALREAEVAGIISHQRGFEPKHLPGFAGEVTEVESLSPMLAGVKQRLIQTHLYFGGKP